MCKQNTTNSRAWKFIFIYLVFISNIVYAQTKYKSQKIHNVDVIFFVDNIIESIPVDVVNGLNSVPISELDDGIVYYLIRTGKYQNVLVKELIHNESKKTVYLVTAHSAKKIQNIIFEGIIAGEQSALQKNLTLQAGKTFKEYLIPGDVKKIEENVHSRGYPNAQIKSFRIKRISNNLVTLIYTIEKGEACRIDQVFVENSNANILNFINLPIETGSLCDTTAIQDKLDQIKNNYWRQGYLTAETKIKEIAYSPNKERAKLVLYIEKGRKTIVKIKDDNNNLLDSDFLNSKQNALTYTDLLLSSNADLNVLLVNYYQKMGYLYATVTGPTKYQDNNGNKIIEFTVKRKNFVKIGDVFFVGDLPEKKGKVLKELQLDKGVFSADIPFFQANLVTYRDKLRNIFFRNGYADAQVPIPDFNFSADGKQANLIFNCIAGDKYTLSEIEIQNLPEGFSLRNKKLDNILTKGDVVNFDNKQIYIDELKAQLLDHGYLYSQIKLEQSLKQTEPGVVFVTLIVNVEAGPIVKVGKVYVQGDLLNKEKSILSISKLEEGQTFSQRLLDTARSHILRHNLFSSVAVEPLDPTALDRKELMLDVVIRTHARTGFLLTLSPGWGTFRGYRFGVDYSLNKITEDGLRLVSSASVSQEKQQLNFASTDTRQILGEQLNLGFTEPLFKLGPLHTPLDLGMVAGYQVAAETLTNREYQTLKFQSEWKPSFFDHNWNFLSIFIHEKSTSTSSESAIVQTIDSPSLTIREFFNSAAVDTRNNISWPTSGGIYSFGFGLARFGMGSDVQYNRYLPTLNYYFPIYNKLSGAIYMGGVFVSDTINRTGETVTPPASRRATLTDDSLIRGFSETNGSAALGPLLWVHYNSNSVGNCKTQLASVGGTNLLYFKSEGRYRINNNFGLITFFDSGENYLTRNEVDQVKKLITSQVNFAKANQAAGQCNVDGAGLVAPEPLDFESSSILEQYWRQAYVSTGIGLRVLLGDYASINLDYGYPLKEPSQNQNHCMSPSEALTSNTAPQCVSRLQDSNYDLGIVGIKFKGGIHLGIGAKF